MKKIFSIDYLKSKGLPYEAEEKNLCPGLGWTSKYEIIFEDEGKFWKALYECRITAESGFFSSWDYIKDIECEEVPGFVMYKCTSAEKIEG